MFSTLIKPNLTIYDLIPIISCAEEFADLPVRHNEDLMNKELHKKLPYQYENINYGGSHDKTNLLFQAHFSRISMPISDYDTDLKLVLDNSIRILLFMADIAYQKKILDTTLKILTMIQMVMQGLWHDDSSLYSLPYLDESDVCNIMNKGNVSSLCELCEKASNKEDIEMFLKKKCELTRLKSDEANQICELLKKYPLLEVKFKVFAGNAKTMERIYDRPINANEDCHIRINITRRNYDANDSKGNLVIHAKYPKIKSCRWFIVIGNERTNEILAFEKVSFKQFYNDFIDCFSNYNETQVKEIYDNLKLPTRATKGSAGYDFYIPLDITLKPNETIKIPTGIRCKINDGWFLAIFPRSGLGFKYRLQLNNTVGIIDADYYNALNEGHIMSKLTNDSKENKVVTIEKGMAFTQGIFLPFGITVDDDSNEVRTGGFGSTTK